MKTLFLLPNLLDEELPADDFLPPIVAQVVRSLDGLIAESERGGRRYLRRFQMTLPIKLLNEHTPDSELKDLLQPIVQGEKWGLISDAGLPCLADPGSKLVFLAKQKGIEVKAFMGPSSLVLALMLSGLPAQAFTFHGYLPRERDGLAAHLKVLEKEKATQVFIEAPYRSQKMLEFLLLNLKESTLLCAAWNLTLPTQGVITETVKSWKQKPSLPDLKDKPTVFLFQAK